MERRRTRARARSAPRLISRTSGHPRDCRLKRHREKPAATSRGASRGLATAKMQLCQCLCLNYGTTVTACSIPGARFPCLRDRARAYPEGPAGADGGTRTHTGRTPRDFKSLASTIPPRPRGACLALRRAGPKAPTIRGILSANARSLVGEFSRALPQTSAVLASQCFAELASNCSARGSSAFKDSRSSLARRPRRCGGRHDQADAGSGNPL
jgi:hypothetical protein